MTPSTQIKEVADERVMGEVHRLIAAQGKQEALKFDLDRRVVEAAAAYMTTEEPVARLSA